MATVDADTPQGDEPEMQLYKSRVKIIPRSVSGFFRSLKWRILVITLGVYYLTPWIRWDRGEGAPDQAVLVDMANRRFYFFFIEIWPQEFYYVAGLLIMAGLGLFLVTSVVGRAWCGYFCPQTVWTDLYLMIERFIEGDRNAQLRLDKAPMGVGKALKRGSKHLIFLLIAVATGGAWVFYFADAPTLATQLIRGEAAMEAYLAIAVLTFTTYALGGLMREQVCTYMCPWPRIQGAMLDERSLTVTYQDWRGEPRGKGRRDAGQAVLGDCVDCNACVAVCPMGIDIRDGQQLECITCALCIDACDEVMDKLGRPRGLVSYCTLEDYTASQETKTQKQVTVSSLFKPRTLIYFGLWSLVGAVMVVSLLIRDRMDVSIQHDRNPQFITLSDGAIRNGYTVKILNMRLDPRLFSVSIDGLPAGATLRISGDDSVSVLGASTSVYVSAEANSVQELRMFVETPRGAVTSDRTPFSFHVEEITGTEEARYDAAFFAP